MAKKMKRATNKENHKMQMKKKPKQEDFFT